MLSRALGAAGTGSGLSTRNLGDAVGEEAHALTVTEMPSHSHVPADGSTGILSTGSVDSFTTAGPGVLSTPINSTTLTNTGGGAGHNTIQPTTFLNFMIKL
jgi:microcystin-dependent protein